MTNTTDKNKIWNSISHTETKEARFERLNGHQGGGGGGGRGVVPLEGQKSYEQLLAEDRLPKGPDFEPN